MGLFILFLVQMSVISSRRLASLRRPPPPLVWDDFPFLKRYVGGIRTLVSREDNLPEYPMLVDELWSTADTNQTDQTEPATGDPVNVNRQDATIPASSAFNPYPDYSSKEYLSEYGPVRECFLDAGATVRIPALQNYPGVPKGFPEPIMGSYELLGLSHDTCFDRYGRLGPYGYGYSKQRGGSGAGLNGEREGAEGVWKNTEEVDYRNVRWKEAQDRCASANSHRFKASRKRDSQTGERTEDESVEQPKGFADFAPQDVTIPTPELTSKKLLPKTALVLRMWHGYKFRDEDMFFVRSLIAELSLLSGGEYTVHFLIHVQNRDLQIWADEGLYKQVVDESLPEEFRGMGTLWSVPQMELIYPALEETNFMDRPVREVYRGLMLPMQYFAYQHPEYDFFWHWEMDARYTGHWYDFFEKISKWAKQQPRKGLWERSARFFIPAVHGSWEDFKQMVRVQIDTARKGNLQTTAHGGYRAGLAKLQDEDVPDQPVWGPERPPLDNVNRADDPVPPTSYDNDKYKWGVGEDADLITFNSIFDPHRTTWHITDDVTGYNRSQGFPPRRATIGTVSRLSRRLLVTMHEETALKKHTMFSEIWAGSCALHHGYKAVFVPHPVYVDRRWPLDYFDSVFNGGRNGASGGSFSSIYGVREHNFRGTSWFYNSGFAPDLWKRWLGLKVNNDGGEEEEMAGEGRMCLPGILLHPVKNVKLPTEGLGGYAVYQDTEEDEE